MRCRRRNKIIVVTLLVCLVCFFLTVTNIRMTGNETVIDNTRAPYISEFQLPYLHTFKIDHGRTFKHSELQRLWKEASDLISENELYPIDYDINRILGALNSAKIIQVALFKSGTSLKWMLTLEGGQLAIFKPLIAKPTEEIPTTCNAGYEQPRAEIAAFHIHRMFALGGTPYTVGRVVDLNELLSVASDDIFRNIVTGPNNETCVSFACQFCSTPHVTCPENGQLMGSVKYWINEKTSGLSNLQKPSNSVLFHGPFDNEDGFLSMWIGDDKYCRIFRKSPEYHNDSVFDKIVEYGILDYMMHHVDSKATRLPNGLVVVVDYGMALCPVPDRLHNSMASLFQCCRIRKTMLEKLKRYQGKFASTFDDLTKSELFYPLLNTTELKRLDTRLDVVLKVIDICIIMRGGYENVVVQDL